VVSHQAASLTFYKKRKSFSSHNWVYFKRFRHMQVVSSYLFEREIE